MKENAGPPQGFFFFLFFFILTVFIFYPFSNFFFVLFFCFVLFWFFFGGIFCLFCLTPPAFAFGEKQLNQHTHGTRVQRPINQSKETKKKKKNKNTFAQKSSQKYLSKKSLPCLIQLLHDTKASRFVNYTRPPDPSLRHRMYFLSLAVRMHVKMKILFFYFYFLAQLSIARHEGGGSSLATFTFESPEAPGGHQQSTQQCTSNGFCRDTIWNKEHTRPRRKRQKCGGTLTLSRWTTVDGRACMCLTRRAMIDH